MRTHHSGFRNRWCSRLANWLAAGTVATVVFAASLSSAQATFMLLTDADNPCDFRRTHALSFSPITASRTDGVNWKTSLLDSVAPGQVHNLTVEIQHADVCNAPKGSAPKHVYTFSGLPASVTKGRDEFRAEAKQMAHGTEKDITRVFVTQFANPPPAGDVFIEEAGRHVSQDTSFSWSIENLSPLGILQNATVTPSYRAPVSGLIVNGPTISVGSVDPGTGISGLLPNSTLGELSNYIVTAHGSFMTETTLAFIGEVDGVISELDLGAFTELFVGLDRFLVPMLRSDENDLFVGVDLVQWLSQPTEFLFGDLFQIVGGISPLLPGMFFSNSPISVVPGLGFDLPDPYSGDVRVVAAIDGNAVPEPATFILFASALVMLFGISWLNGVVCARKSGRAART